MSTKIAKALAGAVMLSGVSLTFGASPAWSQSLIGNGLPAEADSHSRYYGGDLNPSYRGDRHQGYAGWRRNQ